MGIDDALRHFGMVRDPFTGKSSEADFYTGPQHRDALNFLDHALHSNDLLMALTGERGSGKTTALNMGLNRHVPDAVVARLGALTGDPLQFLASMLDGFGFEGVTASRDEMRGLLTVFLSHQRQKHITAVIILDGIETVPAGVMEELSWMSLLESVRVGQLKLAMLGDERLEHQMFAPRTQVLRQMVRWQHRVEPLSIDETRDYLEFHAEAGACPEPGRLFTPDAIAHIHAHSSGLPGRIDPIALRALEKAAEALDTAVRRAHVQGLPGKEGVVDRPVRRSVASLDILLDHEPKARIRLNIPRLLLGRHPWNDVQLDHDSVSRYHALLVREGGHWTVVDLNSTNGIRVNDRVTRQQRLQHRDVIHVGRYRLVLHEGGGPTQTLPTVRELSDTVILG